MPTEGMGPVAPCGPVAPTGPVTSTGTGTGGVQVLIVLSVWVCSQSIPDGIRAGISATALEDLDVSCLPSV